MRETTMVQDDREAAMERAREAGTFSVISEMLIKLVEKLEKDNAALTVELTATRVRVGELQSRLDTLWDADAEEAWRASQDLNLGLTGQDNAGLAKYREMIG